MNAITIGPLGPLLGSFSVEYERALSSSVSFFIAPSVSFTSLATAATGSGVSTFGFGATAGVRVFPLSPGAGRAPEGFWLGPELQGEYASQWLTSLGATGPSGQTLTGVSAGAQLGYTFLISKAFVISFGGGIGVGLVNLTSSGMTLSMVGFSTRHLLRFSLGYAF